jgi:precorrin-4 methylase
MSVSAEHIESAAKALKLDPDVLRRLTEPSQSRTVPVRLRLLGNEAIYVSTQESARDLERTDRAYDAVTAVTAA